MNLSPESDSDAIDGLRNDLLAIIEKRGTPREYAPRTTRQLNALLSLISERDALKERAENAERSERRLAAMLTHQQELEAERDALREALKPFATAYIGSSEYLTRADYRRAYLAYHNTQPDQGGKAE